MSVIIPDLPHTNFSNNENYYHKTYKKALRTMELDTPLGGQVVNVHLEMHILAALPPILNGRLGLVGLPQCFSLDWAR